MEVDTKNIENVCKEEEIKSEILSEVLKSETRYVPVQYAILNGKSI